LVKYHKREEIVKKEVIESGAKKIGFVKDLAFTLDGKLILVIETITEKGYAREGFLSFNKIEKIGDVILVKSFNDLDIPPLIESLCPNCKAKNPVDSKFCAKCGITLQESPET
jgi:sporulation protein YlmC with PRC-barrel domain